MTFIPTRRVFSPISRRPIDAKNLGAKLQSYFVALHDDAKQIAKTYEERLFVIELEYLLEEVRTNSADGVTEFDPAAIARVEQDYDANLPAWRRADEKRMQIRREMEMRE